jgi:hypothetical protein
MEHVQHKAQVIVVVVEMSVHLDLVVLMVNANVHQDNQPAVVHV